MFKPVSAKPDFVTQEREVMETWRKIRALETLRRKNRGRQKFSFLDGPI